MTFMCFSPQTILRHAPRAAVLWFMLSQLTMDGVSQADMSPEQVKAEAMAAFEVEDWELAHRRFAELLSLDGTDAELQMRYAATLLHDARLRNEGIQRLASMANQGTLSPEGLYWWGRAWMLQGEPEEAAKSLRQAIGLAGKKSKWKDSAQLALDQCREMPVAFDLCQLLQKMDAVDVPLASFHRYVQWEREGVRLMLAPDEVQSKLDRKRGVSAPVTFWRGTGEVFYHSLGAKGETGLDIWLGRLDEEGEFSERSVLPAKVNSPYDEINPVWDAATECLHFASNRPGTVGGMDIYRSCRSGDTWSEPESLGPMFNSVLDEWAYYPGEGPTTSWLVTGREAHYGGAEVWEVVPDGPPSAPIVLTTQWDISEDVVPGTLRLSDAETGQDLATVALNKGRGMCDLVVASGQVLRYAFESESGELVEGTYALPEVGEASAVTQTMVMSMVEGAPFMEARPIATDASPMPSLKWGWDMVTNEVQTLEVQEWIVEEEVPMVAEEVTQPARRIVQFKSYPWWTETQKEERAIASNLLSTYIPDPEIAWPEASDFSSLSSYSGAIKALEDATIDHAVNAVMALASADVLKDETPWEEALKSAVLRASQLWEVGSLNVEEVGRKAQRKWAQAGAMYDQNSLPEVRDKRSLVGDGKWVEEPWIKGQVAQLADIHKRVRDTSPGALKVAWHLAQANRGEQNWDAQWEDPSMWEITSLRRLPLTEYAQSAALSNGSVSPSDGSDAESPATTLQKIRLRMAILESLEPSAELAEEEILEMVRQWRGVALEFAQFAGQNEGSMAVSSSDPVGASEQAASTEEDAEYASQQESNSVSADGVEDDAVTTTTVQPISTDELSAKLDREWALVWNEVISLVDPSHEAPETEKLTSATVEEDDVVSDDATPDAWRLELMNWLKATVKTGALGSAAMSSLEESATREAPTVSHSIQSNRPLDVLEAMVRRFEMDEAASTTASVLKSNADVSVATEFEDSDLKLQSMRKEAMLNQIKGRATDVLSQEETAALVQSFWAIASWLHHPDWRNRSPDQMLALNGIWLAETEQELEAWSVDWARSSQINAPMAALVGSGDEEDVADLEMSTLAAATSQGREEGEAKEKSLQLDVADAVQHQPELEALELGALGLHLGWFKNNPQLAGLPSGMRLESEMGNQGLRRWVLILPKDMADVKMTDLSSWLVQAGLGDAYQVHWHGDSWRKEPFRETTPEFGQEEMEESIALLDSRDGETSTADPSKPQSNQANRSTSEGRTVKEELSDAKNELTEARQNSDENTAASSTGAADNDPDPTTANQSQKSEHRDNAPSRTANPWNDVNWEHGAPIELGDLMGSWFAVQVGAFRGQPERDWVEKAGERLVYEPFDDGLARWYAGVRQDEASTWERWNELRNLTGFEDAFVVQLRNGGRELMVAAEAVANPQASSDPSVAESTEPQQPQKSQAAAQKSKPTFGKTQRTGSWHIDIAKYYGTVPSRDVAALLFKAADWGVSSVELLGQTTYMSRSVDDLTDAETLLAKVQSEGFVNATIVEE